MARALDALIGLGLNPSPYSELREFVEKLLDPEAYGYSVSKEVRNEARRLLGLPQSE